VTRPEIPWSFLFAAAAIGLALRLGFGLLYWTGQPLTRDEREYLSLARSVAAGNGFVYDAEVQAAATPPFGRAPGYPAFLAMVGGGRGIVAAVPTPVKVAQSLMGAVGVVILGVLGARLAGSATARAAAIGAAIYPPLVWIASYAFSEAIAWPLGLLAAWLFDRAVDSPAPGGVRALVAGLAIGATALVRPGALMFLLIACGWLAVRLAPRAAIVCLAGALLVVLPWTARNYVRFGRIVLVASEGGVTFWTGNNPGAIGDGDFAANPALRIDSDALRRAHPGLSEEQMEPIYYRDAWSWMRSHPVDWLALEARKAFYLVVPIGPSYRVHSVLYYASSLLSYSAALILAVAGSFRLGARRRRIVGVWLLAASAVVTCLIFFSQERFRIPAIDPALLLCASGVWAAALPREA
jgi:hypothetical protein